MAEAIGPRDSAPITIHNGTMAWAETLGVRWATTPLDTIHSDGITIGACNLLATIHTAGTTHGAWAITLMGTMHTDTAIIHTATDGMRGME